MTFSIIIVIFNKFIICGDFLLYHQCIGYFFSFFSDHNISAKYSLTLSIIIFCWRILLITFQLCFLHPQDLNARSCLRDSNSKLLESHS